MVEKRTMKFEIGKTYGSYEFLDPLGSSKTILAYRVRNVLEQRVELLRILPQMLGGDQERMERFRMCLVWPFGPPNCMKMM
jgi:hypothetical protein